MTPTPPGKIDSEALKAIVSAVYPAILSEPATVRTRAQSAYSIASATAAALITAGALGGISEFPIGVQILGALSVGIWLLTAALFVNISRRVIKIPRAEKGELLTEADFANRALKLAVDESERLESRLTCAARSTYAALAVTGVALLLALAMPPTRETPSSTVSLTDVGVESIADVCPKSGGTLKGDVHLDTLDDDYVVIDVSEGCGSDEVTIRVPPKQVQAVRSSG